MSAWVVGLRATHEIKTERVQRKDRPSIETSGHDPMLGSPWSFRASGLWVFFAIVSVIWSEPAL